MHICEDCGSKDVYCDSWVNMNNKEDIQLFESTKCMDCGGENSAVEVNDDFDTSSLRLDWLKSLESKQE